MLITGETRCEKCYNIIKWFEILPTPFNSQIEIHQFPKDRTQVYYRDSAKGPIFQLGIRCSKCDHITYFKYERKNL